MRKARLKGERKHISLESDAYYELLRLKGELKADTWTELVEKLVELKVEHDKMRGRQIFY